MAEITLEKKLGVQAAVDFKAALSPYLGKGHADVTLVAEHVEYVDTAGLQILIGFIDQIKKEGGAVHWQSPSDSLTSTAELLGLHQLLQLGG